MSEARKVEIKIEAHSAKATEEIKKISKEFETLKKNTSTMDGGLKNTSKQLDQTTRSFASLTKHISQLAIIYGAFGGLMTTVRTFADFEQSLKRLEVISGATSVELEKMKETAIALGDSSAFSASQVVDGMNAMAMSGLSAKQSMEGIGAVLDIAAIEMISIEEAATIATRAMNGFRLEATEMSRISDVMAMASSNSATSVVELGAAYETAAPIAESFGVSIEETTAALGLLADAGRTGSEAGTQLKIVMQRLAANEEAKKSLDEFGISIYDNTGKLLPFKTQLQNVENAMKAFGEGQRNLAMAKIYGTEAMGSALVLQGDLDKLAAKTKQLETSMGYASASAKKMMDVLKGDYDNLTSAVETLVLKLGDELSPLLRDITQDATKFIRSLSPEDIASFGQGIGELISVVGELAKAIINVLGVVKDLSDGVASITGISGAAQVQLLLLGVALRGLYKYVADLVKDIAKFKVAALAASAATTGMTTATTAYTIKTVAATAATRAWNAVLAINPIALAVTAIAGLVLVIQHYTDAAEEQADVTKDAAKQLETIGAIAEVTAEQMGELNEAGRRAFGDFIRDEMADTETEIRKVQQAIEDEEASWFTSAKIVAEKTAKLKLLQEGLAKLKSQEELLIEVNAKKIKQEDEFKKATEKKKKDTETEIKLSEDLVKQRQKEIDQLKKSLEQRVKSTQDAIVKIYEKEADLINDLKDLESDLLKLRQDYANKRAILSFDTEQQIANINAKGLDDYQAYLSAQKRADEIYAKAKEALTVGNLELYKRYISEYDALVAQSAGDEIKVGEQIKLTKSQTAAEAKKDILEAQKLKEQAYDIELANEINIHNTKVQNKMMELQLLRGELLAEKEHLENLAKMTALSTGIAPDLKFDETMNQIKAIDEGMIALQNQKRVANINVLAQTSQANAEIYKTQQNATKPLDTTLKVDVNNKELKTLEKEEKKTITKFVVTDIEKAEADLAALKKEGSEPITSEQQHEIDKAQQAIDKLKALGSEPISSTQNVETAQAISDISQLRTLAQAPMTAHLTIYEHRVAAAQTGGLMIPRFNKGGSSLDNGIGHSRKAGKLSGYGGGDKIKALLEAGEYIVRKDAVRKLGVERMNMINRGELPRFQAGGEVLPRFNTGGLAGATPSSNGKTVELNINMGGEQFKAFTDDDVATALERYTRKYL